MSNSTREEQAIKYQEKHLRNDKELSDTARQELDDIKQAIKYHEQNLSIAKEMGDKSREERAMAILAILITDLAILNKP